MTLTQEGHAGRVYDLTGPQALRLSEVAAILASTTGRPFRYIDVSEAEARKALLDARMPPPVAEAVLELHALGKAGRSAAVTATVEALTHRPATSFAAFAHQHAASWRA